MGEKMSDIARRIRNMVIAMPYGLETMLGLMNIEESEAVKTACVPVGGTPRIIINPKFVENQCETDQKLFMLIMHELHHVLFGHTRLFQRITTEHNIAFDAVINAMLCRSLSEPEWTALFREYYPQNVYPLCLLRPPEGFPKSPRYPKGMPQQIQNVIEKLYYSNQGTFLEVFELLQRIDQEIAQNLSLLGGLIQAKKGEIEDKLLGEHGDDVKGWEADDDPEIFDLIRKVVEKWPQPRQPIRGRSLNDILEQVLLDIPKIVKPNTIILRAIHEAARNKGSQRGHHRSYQSQLLQQFQPSRDRKGFALLWIGGIIPIYREQLPKIQRTREKVFLYIDVSGSMNAFRKAVIAALISCQKEIESEIYLFSTKIVSCSLEKLKQGKISTTGGTSGDCIFAHIEENQAKAVVILTDGYIGKPLKRYQDLHKKVNIQTILTPNGFKDDLKSISRKFHQLL